MNENNRTTKNLFYAAIDVLKRFFLIVFVAITVGMGAFVTANEFYTPTYTTSVTFIVTSRESTSNAYTNLSTAQNLVEVLDLVLQSDELQQLVMRDTGWDSLPGEISTRTIAETNLLVMSVSAHSPKDAFLLMRSVLNNYPTIFLAIADDAVMTVYAPATVPTSPDNPLNAESFAKKIALLGMLASALFIGFISYFRSNVRSAKTLQNSLNAPLLTVLPCENRRLTLRQLLSSRKSPPFLTDISCSSRYVEGIKILRGKLESAKRQKGQAVFLLTSAMPNEGKSTVAANLALALAQKRYKVILIDGDLRNSSQHVIFKKKAGVINDLNDLIYAEGDYSHISLKPDPKTNIILLFSGVIFGKNNRFSISNVLSPIIEYVKEQADFVIIDTSPIAPVSDAVELADYVDATMLVVQENAESEERVSTSIEILKNCSAQFIGCIYNGERFTPSQIDGGIYGHYGRYGKYGKYGRYESHLPTDEDGQNDTEHTKKGEIDL